MILIFSYYFKYNIFKKTAKGIYYQSEQKTILL